MPSAYCKKCVRMEGADADMINRNELEISISYATEKLKGKINTSDYIAQAETMLQGYVPPTRVKALVMANMPLQTVPNDQIYHLASFLNRVGLMEEDLSQYFEKDEIARYQEYTPMQMLDYSTVVFSNVIKSKYKEEYICKLSYKELYELYRVSAITYNTDTQRVSNIGKRGNVVFKMPKINKDNIESIKRLVLNGRFQSNNITFNIRKTGSESYNFANSELVVHRTVGETFIDVLDGWHRCSGIYEAIRENPNLDGDMTITIKNLDVDEARLFIIQEAKGAINNQAGLEFYDPDNNIVKLISDINVFGSESNNVLFNKIYTPTFSPKGATIPFELLAKNLNKSIGELLSGADIKQLIAIKRYIVEFYNIFIDTMIEMNKVRTREDLFNKIPILQDAMFFTGIIILATTMYKDGYLIDDFVLEAENIVSRIDFKNAAKNSFVYIGEDRYRYERYYRAWSKVVKK